MSLLYWYELIFIFAACWSTTFWLILINFKLIRSERNFSVSTISNSDNYILRGVFKIIALAKFIAPIVIMIGNDAIEVAEGTRDKDVVGFCVFLFLLLNIAVSTSLLKAFKSLKFNIGD